MIRTRTAIAAAFMVSMAFTASSLSPRASRTRQER